MTYTTERPATRETGPNDTSTVVWDLGKSFLYEFVFFYY